MIKAISCAALLFTSVTLASPPPTQPSAKLAFHDEGQDFVIALTYESYHHLNGQAVFSKEGMKISSSQFNFDLLDKQGVTLRFFERTSDDIKDGYNDLQIVINPQDFLHLIQGWQVTATSSNGGTEPRLVRLSICQEP